MPKFIGFDAALAMHQTQINVFGGTYGLCDQDLLEKVLRQAQTTYGSTADIHETAAQYCVSLAKTHPFFDGNKRLAADCMLTFLALKGIDLSMDSAQVFEWTMRAAMSDLDVPALAALLREHSKENPQAKA